MEISKPQETPSDAAIDSEVFRLWMSLMQSRLQIQSKCIELSLHVTTGLAGAIAAVAIAKSGFDFADLHHSNILAPVVLVFGLYGLIETLILSNYIYHAYALRGNSLYHTRIMLSMRRTFGYDRIDELSKEITGLKGGWRKVFKLSRGFLSIFQPLVFYISVAIGWLAVTWSLPQVWQSCWSYLIVVLIWVSLFVLAFLHWLAALNPNFANFLVHKNFEETYASIKVSENTKPFVP
ncbi:MAG: hypothetical protein WAO21_06055 [Verrucomicrobiia bacterium]|jgi:hypothetical protein